MGARGFRYTDFVVLLIYPYDHIRIVRARSDDFLRFGEHLAQHPSLGASSTRALAAELELPYTTVIEWWRHLEFHRAILATPGEAQVDRTRLLQVLTAHRVARLTPSAIRRVGMDARDVAKRLRKGKVPYALAMLSAANEWAFFEPRRTVQLYVPRQALGDLRRLVPPEAEGPVLLEVFQDNLTHLPTQRRGDVTVTSPFQTLIDCRAHPEGGAHAAFLEKEVIQWGSG